MPSPYPPRYALRCGVLVVAALTTAALTYHAVSRPASALASLPLPILGDVPLLLDEPSPAALPAYQLLSFARAHPLSGWRYYETDSKLRAEFPAEVRAGEEAEVTFTCSHPDPDTMCAPAYRLLLDGPSLVSPPHVLSSEKLDQRKVRVKFRVDDPGRYRVYAFPEHEKCDQWNNAEVQYHQLGVGGTPYYMTVKGDGEKESSEICQPSQAFTEPGRWVSKAHVNPNHLSIQSPHYDWLSTQLEPISPDADSTVYSHFWAPYNCKVPHHNMRDWLEIAAPESVVFFGDSVIRDWFCLIMWANLFGTPEPGTTCAYSGDAEHGGYHTTNKEGTYTRASDGKTTTLRFFWAPSGDGTTVRESLKGLASPPTHVLYSAALWLALLKPDAYIAQLKPGLQAIKELAPKANTVVRGSAAVVQAIQCYDRIGGQRFQLEPNNAALKQMLDTSFPSFSYFDAYTTLNSHPGASSDGRHWGAPGVIGGERPQIGTGEFALLDRLFLHWSAPFGR
ncbi:hypothetical protein JCM10212_006811 [Sporobolomyces blumeae]